MPRRLILRELLHRAAGANPTLPASEIRSALRSSAYDLGTPGKDPVLGMRWNAANMLSLVYTRVPQQQYLPPTTTIPTPTPTTNPPPPKTTYHPQPWIRMMSPRWSCGGRSPMVGVPAPEGIPHPRQRSQTTGRAKNSIVSTGRYGGSGAFDQRLKIVLTQGENSSR